MTFRSLLVSAADTPALLARVRERLGAVTQRFDLGVVYLNDALAPDAHGVLEGLRLITGIRSWAGGIAMGVCGAEGEIFDRPALSLLLASLPRDSFRVFAPGAMPADDPQLGAWCEREGPYLGLVHATPGDARVPQLLRDLAGDRGPFLVGGLLSARNGGVQIADAVVDGPVSGVLFTRALSVITRLSQGCTPIAPRHRITRARDTLVLELDGRPALDVLAEDLRAAGGVESAVHVGLLRRGSDTGDYLVRDVLGVDSQTRGLLIGHDAPLGDELVFCRRDATSAERDLERMLDELAAALPGPVRAGIYVSCIARGPHLFARPGLETGLIRERLGEFPLAGFFANGEISGDRLYGYTGVLTVFC